MTNSCTHPTDADIEMAIEHNEYSKLAKMFGNATQHQVEWGLQLIVAKAHHNITGASKHKFNATINIPAVVELDSDTGILTLLKVNVNQEIQLPMVKELPPPPNNNKDICRIFENEDINVDIKAGAIRAMQSLCNIELSVPDKQIIEITDDKFKDTQILDIELLCYRGRPFFDPIYQDIIIPAAEEKLVLNNYDTSSNTYNRDEGQESYLGYIPEDDVFVSGWDTWQEGDDIIHCVAFMHLDENFDVFHVTRYHQNKYYLGIMYPDNYNKLHKDFPTLIDIRLD
jgi:hypothetical protein